MKCGTSSLFRYLAQHPQVVPPVRKELHYFSLGEQQNKDFAWYRAHFPLRLSKPSGHITGEGCPAYLFHPTAIESAARALPEARIILLLRDPVERAISHYYHEVRMGREYLPIEQAMEVEEKRLGALPQDLHQADAHEIETYMHASYKKQGTYADHIEHLFQFYPRDQVLVVKSEDFFQDTASWLKDIMMFLGISPDPAGLNLKPKNVGDNKARSDPALIAELRAFFAPHEKRLKDLVGHQFAW